MGRRLGPKARRTPPAVRLEISVFANMASLGLLDPVALRIHQGIRSLQEQSVKNGIRNNHFKMGSSGLSAWMASKQILMNSAARGGTMPLP